MSDLPVTGEVSNSKLAAVFASRDAARDTASAIVAELGLQPAQVKIVGPESADVNIQLEPEGGGIWRTIVVAHVRLGIAGAVAGLLAFGALFWMGIPFVVQSPWAAGLAATGFGATAGLLLGGLVSLRPDHDRYIEATRGAISDGRTTLVVHALSAEQNARSAAYLEQRGADVTRTL